MKPITWIQDSSDIIRPTTDDAMRRLHVAVGQVKELKVVVYPVYRGRSYNQNALFHALINDMASQLGQDRRSVKEAVKNFALSRGYPYEYGDDGYPLEKDGMNVPISTKEATVEQMEILIDSAYEFAFENNLYLEDRL